MNDLINIGVAQLKFAKNPSVLRTILGSCIGICIYDRMKKIGGMAHILLPDYVKGGKPEKYAESAIPILIEQLMKNGCTKEFMSAKIAGGSQMFKFSANISLGQIGARNIEASKKSLESAEIKLLAEDVGGSTGRVIDFFLVDGRLKVKAAGKENILYKV